MSDIDNVEEKKYVLDSGTTVSLRANIFLPKESTSTSRAVTIFLTGWSMGVDDKVVHTLCSEFSVHTKTTTIAIETYATGFSMHRSARVVLREEAQAICMYIKEQGIRRVRITGHSQGGDKAIHVASILQEDSTVDIEGLILLDAVGLYEQKPLSLITGFIKDMIASFVQAFSRRQTVSEQTKKIGLLLATDVLWRWIHDVRKAGIVYPARFAREVSEMTQRNPYMKEIKSPVVLISGASDTVSDIAQFSGKYGKKLFPQSKAVALFTPKKLGHHGVPFYRPAFVVQTALTALSRL